MQAFRGFLELPAKTVKEGDHPLQTVAPLSLAPRCRLVVMKLAVGDSFPRAGFSELLCLSPGGALAQSLLLPVPLSHQAPPGPHVRQVRTTLPASPQHRAAHRRRVAGGPTVSSLFPTNHPSSLPPRSRQCAVLCRGPEALAGERLSMAACVSPADPPPCLGARLSLGCLRPQPGVAWGTADPPRGRGKQEGPASWSRDCISSGPAVHVPTCKQS